MKKYLFIATALAALASCSDNEFVGDVGTTSPTGQENGVISFTSSSKAVTRAIIGETAAGMLNNNFVLLGTKGTSHDVTVFNNYQANYVSNTANTTESNSSNWEYVGYKNLPNGVGTNVGVIAFAATTTGDINNSTAIDQTIKYWDYAAPQYDFAAYSLGKGAGTTPTYATATAISFASLASNAYTLTGSADELKACYISDLVTAYNVNNGTTHISDYGNPVQFSFRSLGAKIRIAFYETIPGYSVKNVQFYTAATGGTAGNTATLFTSTAVLPSGSGTMTVKFPTTGLANRTATDYNKAHVSFAQASGSSAASTLTFGVLANYPTTYEGALTEGSFIGRTSNTATYADGGTEVPGENEGDPSTFTPNSQGTYYTVLPNETGANLQLRIKYTLRANDNYGDEITVDNATAVVPAEFAQWNPNYAYTYIFKIGDMTNGSTGTDGNGNIVYGLTPITLDAVVVNSETGVQETITTVSEPSITTYTKGVVVTANDEYVTGNNIYVIVNNGTSNEVLTDKAKLYIVTIEDGAAQTISEESVANAIAQNTDGYDIGEVLAAETSVTGYYTYNSSTNTYTEASGTADGSTTYYKKASYSVKDANGKKLVVNEVANDADDELNIVGAIAAADSPTGNEINIGENKVGKFTAGAAGTVYAFQYKISAAVNGGSYDATTAATYNATLPGAIHEGDACYSFDSYAGASAESTKYGSGKVKVVSQQGEWTTVLVTSNDATDLNAENFVGRQFRVKATTLTANQFYQLYPTDSETALPIYVTVTTGTYTAEDANAYNETLSGAITDNGEMPTIPGKYQYKIIKIKNS